MNRIDGHCVIGFPQDPEPLAEQLLVEMDKVNVARAVISPPPRCFAWENEAGNDLVIAAAKSYPDRFIPAVTANPWRPDAIEVLTRYFEKGGKVLIFSPGPQGFVLSEGLLTPVLEKIALENWRCPVYVHTGHHSHAAPAQLALLARRYPKINFIMGHCGATDYSADVVIIAGKYKNIYLESSFARPSLFLAKIKTVGYEKAIMGSGSPYNDMTYEWNEMLRLVPVENQESVLGGNLQRLLEGKA
jgi:predicted TIM-barrel fold metal-dependent hydrolase